MNKLYVIGDSTLEQIQFWVSESLIMFAYNANEKDYEIIQLV